MLSLLLTLTLAQTTIQSQAWTTPVAFHVQAEPVSIALDRLSKIVGEPLKVKSPLADDLIIVHTDSSTPQEIIDKIAWAEYGKWADIDNIKTLVSDRPTAVQAQAKHEQNLIKLLRADLSQGPIWPTQTFGDSFKDALDRYKKSIDAQELASIKAVAKEITLNDPYRRVFARLFAAIGPTTLAKTPVGGELVFSSIPSRYHLPLPNTTSQILADFTDEMRAFGQIRPTYKGPIPSMYVIPHNEFEVSSRDALILKVVKVPDDMLVPTLFSWKDGDLNELRVINGLPYPDPVRFDPPELPLPKNLEGQFKPSDETEGRITPLRHPQALSLVERRALAQTIISEIGKSAPDTLQALANDLAHQISTSAGKLVVGLLDDASNPPDFTHGVLPIKDAVRVFLDRPSEIVDEPKFWGFRPREAIDLQPVQMPRQRLAATLTQFLKQPEISFFGVADALKNSDLATMERVLRQTQSLTSFTATNDYAPDFRALKVASLLDNVHRNELAKNGSLEITLKSLPGIKSFVTDQLVHTPQYVRDGSQNPYISDFEGWSSGSLDAQQTILLSQIDLDTIELHLEYKSETASASRDESQNPSYYRLSSLTRTVLQYYPSLDLTKPRDAENKTVVLLPVTTLRVQIKLPGDHSIVWFSYLPKSLEKPTPFSADNPPQAFKDEIDRIKRLESGGH